MNLKVDGLSFSFGDSKVLKGVSFEVHSGEFFGLMGPNGSGKTTLLRCITNFYGSEPGSITVDSKMLQEIPPRSLAKVFAVVPQTSVTDFPFTARDIVMMGRIPHIGSMLAGESRTDGEVVSSAMERTNTLQFASRPFTALSGGERQRVIIARAIAQRPQALLLDEPTVYLDISGQIEIMDLLRNLNKEEGITTIAVLHDINLAARYCNRIALMSEGRLEAVGPPKEVLTQELIQSVYGVDVAIREDPVTRSVYIMPRSTHAAVKRHGTRVHVLCGGGSGSTILKTLHDNGYGLSVGVLNILDSDYESAKDMHIQVVTEAPFAPINPENHAENLRLIDETGVVVVSPFPVGPGNLKNLEAAKYAMLAGKQVYVMKPEKSVNVDFVNGKADSEINGLISSGAIVVRTVDELIARLTGKGG